MIRAMSLSRCPSYASSCTTPYQSLRNADRLECTEKVKDVLFNYCEDIVETAVKREKDVMNLACLVEREKLDEFAKGVFEASKLFDNVYLFDYTGPWAPHNFITLDLHVPTVKKGVLTTIKNNR